MSAVQRPVLTIGITQRRRKWTTSGNECDALDDTWPAWIALALPGALLVPIANNPDALDRLSIDGLILSGGEDVGTGLLRDATERAALGYALRENIPVVGVCRGMQFLHLEAGGSLVALDDHVGRPHSIKLTGGFRAFVNSWHRWGIRQARSDWAVVALADDGTIEAFRHRERPWFGVMSHPEREHGAIASQWASAVLAQHPIALG